MNTYTIGTEVQCKAVFVDQVGNLDDPTVLTSEIREPDGTVVDTTGDLVHLSLGTFAFDFTPTKNGLHIYRIAGTQAVYAAGESSFMAQGSFA